MQRWKVAAVLSARWSVKLRTPQRSANKTRVIRGLASDELVSVPRSPPPNGPHRFVYPHKFPPAMSHLLHFFQLDLSTILLNFCNTLVDYHVPASPPVVLRTVGFNWSCWFMTINVLYSTFPGDKRHRPLQRSIKDLWSCLLVSRNQWPTTWTTQCLCLGHLLPPKGKLRLPFVNMYLHQMSCHSLLCFEQTDSLSSVGIMVQQLLVICPPHSHFAHPYERICVAVKWACGALRLKGWFDKWRKIELELQWVNSSLIVFPL